MIIQAFLRWVETAKASDRARAASALGRAYAAADMNGIDRHAAEMAMTFLLDDPSPKVRLSLVEALADCPAAPRAIMKSLAEDQPEIAFVAIARSPVLTDADLVDIAARGTAETRALIAARKGVSCSVAAALAEIGDEEEVLILLENDRTHLSRRTLTTIVSRLGHVAAIRDQLLLRDDLPGDARQLLAERVGTALAGCGLIQATIGAVRAERVRGEACDAAALAAAAVTPPEELPLMVAHLRESGRLTPAFLMKALCGGAAEFFIAAMVELSGVTQRRVRAILSGGRVHPIRALFESAGLGPDLSAAFAEAVLLWQREARETAGAFASIVASLHDRLRRRSSPSSNAGALAELVENLAFAEKRRLAREYASLAARQAA
ncbi:uncharacterized protein (DUF2336 family) [Sinorhizobium kostiense]|uniref:Uncharacterized protein (DUF2336 family) n=1 Tax=Sinorhizobium kostiense TaxID=76747 RepID=A0ABS4R4W8_9HYPH|nr:DUF2336 domain-containing protein [Sinorhizobium kostiense]MBP2237918.1 uncharacterized protein (DUF2336 family) [Sinorhizobium kostiense]